MVFDSKSIISREDLKKLQQISICLRGMSFGLENCKKISENYLFVDCGEKLDPNDVLHKCYNEYQSINIEEIEKFATIIDNICFPNGFDFNNQIFDELYEKESNSQNITLNKEKHKDKKKNYYHPYEKNNSEKTLKNNFQENNNNYFEYNCGYDKTLYKLGHLSMNPREEPFLGDDA